MQDLAHQRCLNHASREAVARCPECGHYFCRECITEHEDRVVCASCLRKLVESSAGGGHRVRLVLGAAQCFLGVLTAWLFFYLVGRVLVLIPTSFHEGTVWESPWWQIQ